MKSIFIPVLSAAFLLLVAATCGRGSQLAEAGDDHKYSNALVNESSPYLLQHAYNPVNWHPWGEEALKKAEEENKMLIISVGYAACHWCHVMEHESFEDTVVAALMNKHFLPIKVDREERPDVDQIYMDACHLMNQRGGWPLNALALPDGRPFYAGTYYPKDKWLEVLNYFIKLKEEDYAQLEEQAAKVTEGIAEIETIPFKSDPQAINPNELNTQFNKWIGRIDLADGGRQGAPKFPMPSNYLYLLKYFHLTENQKALQAIELTLEKMARGGIYDHLGGGFARYSTDAQWKVPHFEKMTYDNGQLVSLYAQAYRLNKNPLYRRVVEESLAYVKREMTSPEGGFYSSLDADSEGEEGKFYVWDEALLDSLIGEDADLFKQYYTVKKSTQWEHSNILYVTKSPETIARKNDLTLEELEIKMAAGREKLWPTRETRIRPGLDDKILTSWNALMLRGYVDAFRSFRNPEYLQMALKNAAFIVDKQMQSDGRLNRNYKDGRSSINGFLDDYALTIEAFIELYQVTFDENWLMKADKLMSYVLEHFSDEETKMFFYTSDIDKKLIARKMEISDNVIPSSNSSLAMGLLKLGTYLYKEDYIDRSKQMMHNVKEDVVNNGPFYSNWSSLMYHLSVPMYEVAVMGEDWEVLMQEYDQEFHPNVLFMGGTKEGSLKLLEFKLIPDANTIYVCQNKACKLPVKSVKEARQLMQ